MDKKQAETKPENAGATPGASTSVQNTAPEDQHASGGQQAEQKHELKNSVKQQQNDPGLAENSGLHSTGSYTGTAGGPDKSGKP